MELFCIISFDYYKWPMILVFIVVIGIVLFLKYLRRNDDYWEKRGVQYYPRQNLISILRLLSKMTVHDFQVQIYKQYNRVHGGFQLTVPSLVVSDPELLKDIFVKDFHVFNFRRKTTLNDKLLDNMVSVLMGEDWKRVRTIITPAFTSKRMRKMGDIITRCTKAVIETFDKHYQKGEPVDCKEVFGAFTVDVIASAAFATKIDSVSNPDNLFVQMFRKIFQEMSVKRVLFLTLIPQRVLVWLRLGGLDSLDFFKSVILQVIEERRQSKKTYNDVLQTLMDAVEEENIVSNSPEAHDDMSDQYGSITTDSMPSSTKYKRLTEDEVVAQCVLFFFAGYETTASTLTFMAYALASNQDWQEKLLAEVDECFQKHSEISYDAVRGMKILDAVVSETLRMYPPLIATERTATEDYELGNTGIVVEKDMIVGIPVYAMHYDPDFFPDPEVFNPERFMDSSKYNHPQYAYLPFGAGPRNCLGMRFALLEIKLCMVNILRHYRFQICPSTKVPLEYKKLSAFLSVNNLPLGLEKRKIL